MGHKITIGSTWEGGTKRFTVSDVIIDEQGTWVHYTDDTRTYSCLIEAFLQRFSILVN